MSAALGCWVDGVETDRVPADDRGLQYGDGLFETILVRRGIPRFLDTHLARLARGMERLGIPFTAWAELRAEITRAAASAPPLAVLKLIVTRGSAVRRGYAPGAGYVARRIVSLWPTAALDSTLLENGVALDIARLRIAEPAPFAGLKHLNRLENVIAAAEPRPREIFESLLMSHGGHVISCVAANVFLAQSGDLLTPVVARAGVAGVMRQVVLREAARLGLQAREQELTLDELYAADGMFITNARIGVVPVRRVGEHVFAMSDIATRLRTAIEALDA